MKVLRMLKQYEEKAKPRITGDMISDYVTSTHPDDPDAWIACMEQAAARLLEEARIIKDQKKESFDEIKNRYEVENNRLEMVINRLEA